MTDPRKEPLRSGYIHLAFGTGSREAVDRLTGGLRENGYRIVSGPRITGDGCYELRGGPRGEPDRDHGISAYAPGGAIGLPAVIGSARLIAWSSSISSRNRCRTEPSARF